MSDSENDSSSESIQHDRMSVSDQDVDESHDEGDMPSAEIDALVTREQLGNAREEESIATDSISNEDLEQLPEEEGSEIKDETGPEATVDLNEAAVRQNQYCAQLIMLR